MTLKVTLSDMHGGGYQPCVETFDGSELWLDTDELEEGATAADACRDAARQLREAADRFDALAKEAKPTAIKTHDRINAADMAA
jgi:hypothetical protein